MIFAWQEVQLKAFPPKSIYPLSKEHPIFTFLPFGLFAPPSIT